MSRLTIALDGPAGAGKSTIAKTIAKSLKILYLDTGAMYRAVALKALQEGINTLDRERLTEMVAFIDISIRHCGEEQRIFLDGVDVSQQIRTPEVSIGASNVAAVPEVRIKLVELQRAIAKESSIVMDGRDIGTYVLPDASLKIFLTASLEARAKRRYEELLERGNKNISFTEVLQDIERRDLSDSSRDFAPLAKADDAIEIDTTTMSPEEVAEAIIILSKVRVS